jgi:hypothetical protein
VANGACVITLLTLSLCCQSFAYETEHFLIMNIDGVRNDEWRDPTVAVHINSNLKTASVWMDSCFNAGPTRTSPGHPNFFTGVINFGPNAQQNVCTGYPKSSWRHFMPSLMHYYLRENGYDGADTTRAWVFGNAANDTPWGRCFHPGWFLRSDQPSRYFECDKIENQWPDDTLLSNKMKERYAAYPVGSSHTDFHDADTRGHQDTDENRRAAITEADSIINYFWTTWLPGQEEYAGETTLLISTDHGRHSDGVLTGIQDHGCDCDGCRNTCALLLGPDIKQGVVNHGIYYQHDFARLGAHLLGLKAPNTRRVRLATEFLTDYEPEDPWTYDIKKSVSDSVCQGLDPDITVDGKGQLHILCHDFRYHVMHRSKGLDDAGWSAPDTLMDADTLELVMDTRIDAYRNIVIASWVQFEAPVAGHRSWYAVMRRSTDYGETWSDTLHPLPDTCAVHSHGIAIAPVADTFYAVAAGSRWSHNHDRRTADYVVSRSDDLETWTLERTYKGAIQVTEQGESADCAMELSLDASGAETLVGVCIYVKGGMRRDLEVLDTGSKRIGKQWPSSLGAVTFDTAPTDSTPDLMPCVLVR